MEDDSPFNPNGMNHLINDPFFKPAICKLEWKYWQGKSRHYRISTHGDVEWKTKKGKWKELKLTLKYREGTHILSHPPTVRIDGRYLRIAHLVAEFFIDNPLNLPDVAHRDHNLLNNRVDNLFRYKGIYTDKKEKRKIKRWADRSYP